jgi:hypothetical protein
MGPSPYPHAIAKVRAQLAAVTPTPMCGMLHMVSADHFAHELRAQFKKAAARRATSVVVTSGELYQLLGGYPGSTHGMPACCDAMRAEMKPGDILLVESNGVGLTVCYQMPRPL